MRVAGIEEVRLSSVVEPLLRSASRRRDLCIADSACLKLGCEERYQLIDRSEKEYRLNYQSFYRSFLVHLSFTPASSLRFHVLVHLPFLLFLVVLRVRFLKTWER